ncbi:hypothetical protein B0A55_02748 [Friedmanniomyces simplex]|uniref:Uncharacterized protein n=1 Tax=Friedmanniomyces simplex TaxID=329884 RepID=A0A4U0XQ12_9PEZI|nr:hypothetical protein B0A55_02748 [Friedmanniomyces simplex]
MQSVSAVTVYSPLERKIYRLETDLRTVSNENAALKLSSREQRNRHDSVVSEHTELGERIKEFMPHHEKTKESLKALKAEYDQLQRECHELQRAQQKADDEAGKARAQLTLYKSSVSAASKVGTQVTDDEAGWKMDQIFYAIQDFAVTASRIAEFDYGKLSKDLHGWMAYHAPYAERSPKSHVPYIITALIAKSLVARFALEDYFGVSSNPEVNAASRLTAAFKVVDNARTKAWLEPTYTLLAGMDKEAVQKSDQALVDATVTEISHVLGPALHGKWHPAAETSLRKVSTAAFELFRTLHRSKAHFHVVFAEARSSTKTYGFSPEWMQDVANAKEDSALGRPIHVSVFPSVAKFGDEMGNNQEEMTVICKARVILQKEPRESCSIK